MNRLNRDNAYALLIGVGADLKASVTDATAINNVLVDPEFCGYKPENIYLLTEEKAGKYEILEAMDDLIKRTNEESSVLVFYSGHGGYDFLNNEEVFFLQPNDFKSEDKKTGFWVSYIDARVFRDKLADMKSKQLILLMDCCHAAGMTKDGELGDHQTRINPDETTAEGIPIEKPDAMVQEIDNDRGMVVLSSCREDQLSWILDGDVNSLFTKCLLEALKAEHKRFFEEDHISALEAASYIFKKVPERQPAQQPYMNLEIYENFVLTHLPDPVIDRMKNLGVTFDSLPVTAKVEVDSPSAAPGPGTEQVSKSRKVVTSFRETEGANNLLLFIHGFSGEASDTFGIIPELLANESKMDGWDMKPLGFTKPMPPELGKDIWAAGIDVDKIAMFLNTNIKNKFKKYDRIAIVAHSLGGLAAQKALLTLKDEHLSRISHLILLGVPSNGMDASAMEQSWNEKYKDLSSEGDYIKSLRGKWNETFGTKPPFKLKVAAALDDEYVTMESCFADFDSDSHEMIDGDHLRMVKPDDADDDCYNLILNTLTDNEFFNVFTNKEAINLALGKYDAVIKSLLPQKDSLDKHGLKRLIFALEGTDQRDLAVEILKNHPVAEGNSDFMGILGGRYKRSYLKTYDKSLCYTAYEYYNEGYEMAQGANDDSQIYYHTINLAFLNAVAFSDKEKTLYYANIAKEAAERAQDDWKWATLAEAYLYLDNLEESKRYYEKAAKSASTRNKISMHTNAYAGYIAWMKINKGDDFEIREDDDFIRFLKKTLLK